MGACKFLKQEDIGRWVEELSTQHTVLVPTQEDDAVSFLPYNKDNEMRLDRQATKPPKGSVFPQTETLMEYKYVKDEEDPSKVKLEVNQTIPSDKVVVFGGRPCDARGFTMFDRVYDTERLVDPYYKARRENTLFITQACAKPETTCFCNWVGSSPVDTQGSDVLLIPVDGGYVAEAVSEKGEALLKSAVLSDGANKAKEAEEAKEDAVKAMGEAKDLSKAPEKLLSLFDNLDFWTQMSGKCLSCGACTYLCPTCYCFNITDEGAGESGKRVRTWDNCMSHLFTLEASGHNPRTVKANRLKNRVGHKFSYYPTLHGQVFSCCGCGRCIKSCPASVDIREIVLSALEAENE